ncbi:carboxymuconolactone decarboxylase family protein [Chitinophaga sp. SYP-B3965]|uniref:carboxymuconolactone decarboxylase family protein n=1 Tax=Chitinophaga sp. SYP-B3965 TaxID=2663120 RepID=UPI0012996215|nr:carboxymuconolactone decarboxylase family protein [Chitinophaga sp. SYP-B3965]MRG44236.1 carboxymuconolactone decarboxylase family protein [Chitinophaga sp. SYP-B3965]
MRIKPLLPDTLSPEVRFVHDEIAGLVGRSQSQVTMLNAGGALLGPFPPMLQYPQFGIPALSFLRTLDTQGRLAKTVREVAILTVGGAFRARFELYAHEIMGAVSGLSSIHIATLAAGGHPVGLSEEEHMAHIIAASLVSGHVVADSTYQHAVQVLGQDGVAELFFLIGGYSFIAMILNGFDIPAPDNI